MTILEFNEIYKKHWWTVFNFAKVKLTNLTDWYYAEEVTSHVFIHLWKTQPVFEKESNLKAWLYTSAVRRIIDVIRNHKLKPTDPLIYDPIELSIEDYQELERLEISNEVMQYAMEAVKGYSGRERQIFTLYFIQELPAGKIAHILKTKPQTISNQLVTLKNKLRGQIKNRGIDLG